MAQTGYTPIQLYYSTTASTAPLAANLANGELAINITDGKLFYKDNSAAVQVIGWKIVPTTAGGTGLTSYTAGDLLYYVSGATLSKLAIGSTGYFISSTGSAPQWSAPAALTKTNDTNVTLTLGGSASTALLNAASLTLGWSGQLAVGRGGTGLSAGTSGGIPYFSSTSAMTSSALLAANAIVLGGGAGAAPATTTTGTGVVTALGVNTGTAGAFVVNGGALGTPSSGTVTNLTGTASININGTVGATTANTGAFTTLSATGVTTVQAGTAALPAITTTGDTNTGIFFPAADVVGVSTGGSERVRIDSSGNVGIGLSANASLKLQVAAATNITLGIANATTITGAVTLEAVNNARSSNIPMELRATKFDFTGPTSSVSIDTTGSVGINTASPNASAILDVVSTTRGVRFPNMTTTQKNAIGTPAAGLVVFDTTLSKLCVYSGAAWQTITSI